jgi:hypothetical protein
MPLVGNENGSWEFRLEDDERVAIWGHNKNTRGLDLKSDPVVPRICRNRYPAS